MPAATDGQAGRDPTHTTETDFRRQADAMAARYFDDFGHFLECRYGALPPPDLAAAQLEYDRLWSMGGAL